MNRAQPAQPFLSPAVAAGLVMLSALSLIAFLVLSAYAPELRSDRSDGANALSTSAVGFAGLRLLLEDTGTPTELGRYPLSVYHSSISGLVVLTPTPTTTSADLKPLLSQGPWLLVLPKWQTVADPHHAGWVIAAGTYRRSEVAALLKGIAGGLTVARQTGVAPVHLASGLPRFAAIAPPASLTVKALQTIAGKSLEPALVTDTGGIVLGRIDGTHVYVLSDPDLIGNVGIRDLATARLAVGLVQALRVGTSPVFFDLALNGFGSGPSLLRSAFSPPFLGATLCLLLAAAFIAVHAFNRFGPPRPADRVHVMGKRALADNTAAVIRMLQREPRMAPRYAEAMRDSVATHTGATRTRAREADWLQALEKRSGTPERFEELRAEADAVDTTSGLLQVAAKLYNWRQGIMHGHR